jgi:hypothetical protein
MQLMRPELAQVSSEYMRENAYLGYKSPQSLRVPRTLLDESAVGAAQVSPARKGWESEGTNPSAVGAALLRSVTIAWRLKPKASSPE